ncbi:hypothetical protein C2S51_031489 [Perilla frutescens var. frutescens]|nr:hypothetical protein C2S51_031489 [Perilla frutescens var. frutescens]
MLKEMEANYFPVAGEDDEAIAAVLSSTNAPKICFGLNKLRELDALTIRFYEFPMQKIINVPTYGDMGHERAKASSSHGNRFVAISLWFLGKLINTFKLPNDGGESLVCFDHIYHLEKLKCVVVNPESVPRFALSQSFPKSLRKLTLSGLGFSWGEISKIASLKYLEALKLRNYACRGPKWEVREKSFDSLKSLVIEDTDLEEWIIGYDSLRFLESLRVKHCYKLQRIRWEPDRSDLAYRLN